MKRLILFALAACVVTRASATTNLETLCPATPNPTTLCNPLARTYPNARALAQALRDHVGSNAQIVFWTKRHSINDGKRKGELLGEYVAPQNRTQQNRTQQNRTQRGTIFLSLTTQNALERVAHGSRAWQDLKDGPEVLLHESKHSVGLCRFQAPQTSAESDVEEAWAQREAEVVLSRLMAVADGT